MKKHKGLISEIMPLKLTDIAFVKSRRPVKGSKSPLGIIHKTAVLGAAMFQYI